jgi:hypothetical protein
MNTDMLFPASRSAALEEFHRALERAQWGSLLRRLAARENSLESFLDLLPLLKTNRRYLGTVEVPVDRIVGTVDRRADFDRSFRPRSVHLRDRWVNVYLLAGGGDWPPIRLFKAGGRYFVEDGHNRVSVARTLGWLTIRAEVWEYPLKPARRNDHGRDPSRPLATLPKSASRIWGG